MTLLSNQQGRELLAKKKTKRSREGNVPTEYNGIMYQSQKEANRAKHWDWMLQLGQIKYWKRQVPLKIEIGGIHITTYLCDFVAEYNNGKIRYEDCKGRKSGGPYQMFQIKKRLVKALLGIEIIEI